MAFNYFKCNHLMPLHFKGLSEQIGSVVVWLIMLSFSTWLPETTKCPKLKLCMQVWSLLSWLGRWCTNITRLN